MHTLKLPLKTTKYDEYILDKRFRLVNKCHNILVKKAKLLLRKLRRDKEYAGWSDEYRKVKEELDQLAMSLKKIEGALKEGKGGTAEKALYGKLLAEAEGLESAREQLAGKMNVFRGSIGLSKAGLCAYISVFQKRHKGNISSHMAQKEADDVMKAVEAVLFGKGKDIHYRKLSDMSVISSKNRGNGIRFYDLKRGVAHTPDRYSPEHRMGVEFLGLDITVNWTRRLWKYPYVARSLDNKVSYCMIKREEFNSGWRYYLVLVLSGDAPEKFAMGKGTMGGDPGTSTFAAAGKDLLLLEELSPKCKEYNRRIAYLQEKTDRSKRIMNPGNYHPDGRIKKGKLYWEYSRTCLADQRRLRVAYRKKSAYTKCEHNERANRILQGCDTFLCEKMDFPALARRSAKPAERKMELSPVRKKDGTVVMVHKYKKKRRFGSSVTDRSPAY